MEFNCPKTYSQPPSYQQINLKRKFKTRDYSYLNMQGSHEQNKQRESQSKMSSQIPQSNKQYKQKLINKQNIGSQETVDYSKSIQRKRNLKRQQFSLHANNIDMINDRIRDLLNLVNKNTIQQAKQQSTKQESQYRDFDYQISCSSFGKFQQKAKIQISPFENVDIDKKQYNHNISNSIQMTPSISLIDKIDNRIHQKLKNRLSQYTHQKVGSNPALFQDKIQSYNKIAKENSQNLKESAQLSNFTRFKNMQSKALNGALQSRRLSHVSSISGQLTAEKHFLYNYHIDRKYQQSQVPITKYSLPNSNLLSRQKRQTINEKNIKLDSRIKQISDRILQRSMIRQKQRADALSNIQRDSVELLENFISQGQQTWKPTILKMAQKISEFINIEIQFRNLREWFQTVSNQDKWEYLKRQFDEEGIYIENESELKRVMQISVHQKNPFKNSKLGSFSVQGCIKLAKLYNKAEKFWKNQLHKFVSLSSLNHEGFSVESIDINNKGSISIEDLVCFINVNTNKFYRSRDLASLFNRFLQLQGKSLDKNLSEGVCFSTFINMLTRL